MRALLFTAVVAAIVAAAGAAAAPSAPRASQASSGATFVLTGRGWGHGVGFSQCGAIGYGKHGWNYVQILRHYYQGTQITTTPTARVRVLIADGRQSVRVTSKSAFKVKDGSGKTYPLAAGTVDLTTALKVKVDAGKPARALPGPLTFIPGRSLLTLDRPYRGQLVIKVTGGRLRAINSLPLEQYVYGVVPIEIGSSGPSEALKAQAVAARTYALATRRSGGDFDLYPDIRSQSYGGASVEHPETNAAVNATAGRVVTYKGKVITAYYFASSGGRTASVQDVWLGSTPVPYLVSVSDPYDNVCSSEHSWGPYVYSGSALARKLGVSGRVIDARTVVNPSKRVKSLQLRLSGRKVAISGPTVRTTMGLRSTWFRIGVISLTRPASPAIYGLAIDLTGIARSVGPAVLEQRIPGKSWSRGATVRAAANGSFSVRVKPKRPLEYRVAAGKAASGAVRVAVAPRVVLEPGGPGELVGSVRPAFASARIDIERQSGGRWAAAGAIRTDASGRFDAALNLAPGTYRARIGARAGFAGGVSDAVRLTA